MRSVLIICVHSKGAPGKERGHISGTIPTQRFNRRQQHNALEPMSHYRNHHKRVTSFLLTAAAAASSTVVGSGKPCASIISERGFDYSTLFFIQIVRRRPPEIGQFNEPTQPARIALYYRGRGQCGHPRWSRASPPVCSSPEGSAPKSGEISYAARKGTTDLPCRSPAYRVGKEG